MIEIGVYLIINDCYYQARYCIENLLSKTKCNVRLHILDNGSKDHRIIEYLNEISKDNKAFLKRVEEPVSICEAYNTILRFSYQEICCIFPINILVNDFWCEELLWEYTMCENAGIIGIKCGDENVSLATIMHKSDNIEGAFKNVWVSENNSIDGILFFGRDKIMKTGMFDHRLNAEGYEVAELCFRFNAIGLNNYYIAKHTCSKVKINNKILFPDKTIEGAKRLKSEIEAMVKSRNFAK